jgi:hypothetical protein
MRAWLYLTLAGLAGAAGCGDGQEAAATPPAAGSTATPAAAAPAEVAAAAPAAGDPAPAFSLPGSDGQTHSLASFAGRKVVVLAWFPKAFTGG